MVQALGGANEFKQGNVLAFWLKLGPLQQTINWTKERSSSVKSSIGQWLEYWAVVSLLRV